MRKALYRTATGLILLLELGHSAGYPWSDPEWRVDLTTVQSTHFNVLGFSRTYWDFYVGFGLSVSVFLGLAALMAWWLSRLPTQVLPLMRGIAWALALCFAALTLLNTIYFFTIPIAMAGLITVCLAAAAWRLSAERAA